jgi:hypothetical protein
MSALSLIATISAVSLRTSAPLPARPQPTTTMKAS